MVAKAFKVFLTASAVEDLDEIAIYWSNRGETERGEKYVGDLYFEASRSLSDLGTAIRGKILRDNDLGQIRELRVFNRVYRIIYQIFEEAEYVEVLRFWHSHRDEPKLDSDEFAD